MSEFYYDRDGNLILELDSLVWNHTVFIKPQRSSSTKNSPVRAVRRSCDTLSSAFGMTEGEEVGIIPGSLSLTDETETERRWSDKGKARETTSSHTSNTRRPGPLIPHVLPRRDTQCAAL